MLRFRVYPKTCHRPGCGGDVVGGRYMPIRGQSCLICLQCGRCQPECCPTRTGDEADAADADLRKVALLALGRLANGAQVKDPAALALALGAGIGGPPLTPDADDDVRCRAITARGARCKFMAVDGGYCGMHQHIGATALGGPAAAAQRVCGMCGVTVAARRHYCDDCRAERVRATQNAANARRRGAR